MKMFIGREVEHTNLYGELTLFVPGYHPFIDIKRVIDEKKINHVYLGANQSFNEFTKTKILKTCLLLLLQNIKVTLDFDQKYYSEVWNYFLDKNIPLDCLHLNISCKLQYINYFPNVSIKVDDDTLNKTNLGVWTFSLNKNNFTAWSEYNEDKEVD